MASNRRKQVVVAGNIHKKLRALSWKTDLPIMVLATEILRAALADEEKIEELVERLKARNSSRRRLS